MPLSLSDSGTITAKDVAARKRARLSTPGPDVPRYDIPYAGDWEWESFGQAPVTNGMNLRSLDLPALTDYMQPTSEVTVQNLVQPGDTQAESASRAEGADGMNPQFSAALSRANAMFKQRFGKEFRITSGYRTRAEQADLYRRKPGLAVPPGQSRHETGLAVDLNWSDLSGDEQDYLRELLPSLGIKPPSWDFHYNKEPWHWTHSP